MYTITKEQKARLENLRAHCTCSERFMCETKCDSCLQGEILQSLPTQAQPTAGEVQEAIEFVEYMFQGAAWNEGPTHKAVKKIIKAAQSNAEAVELGERCEHCGTLRTDWQNYERSLQRQVEHQVAERLAQSRDDAAGLVEALEFAEATLMEINPSNYSHETVCEMNSNNVMVVLDIRKALATFRENKGGVG